MTPSALCHERLGPAQTQMLILWAHNVLKKRFIKNKIYSRFFMYVSYKSASLQTVTPSALRHSRLGFAQTLMLWAHNVHEKTFYKVNFIHVFSCTLAI